MARLVFCSRRSTRAAGHTQKSCVILGRLTTASIMHRGTHTAAQTFLLSNPFLSSLLVPPFFLLPYLETPRVGRVADRRPHFEALLQQHPDDVAGDVASSPSHHHHLKGKGGCIWCICMRRELACVKGKGSKEEGGREGRPPSTRKQAEQEQLYTRTLVEAVEGLASWLSRPKRVAMLLRTFISVCRGGLWGVGGRGRRVTLSRSKGEAGRDENTTQRLRIGNAHHHRDLNHQYLVLLLVVVLV